MSRLRAALRVLALSCALPAVAATTASAAGSPFVFDGTVDAVVYAGGATYVAGTFTHAYAPTGGGIVTRASGSGTPRPSSFAHVAGEVDHVAADGAGGWYIGGDFRTVGGLPRAGLAHLMADGSVDPAWVPDRRAQVDALAVAGDLVYVAGTFTTAANGATSTAVVAFDRVTGAPEWGLDGPGPETATTLVAAGGTLYVAGGFSSLAGQPRSGLAAVDAATGAIRPWNPAPNSDVRALAVVGSRVYVAGEFTRIDGRPRKGLAALATATGAATAWNPAPDVGPDRLVVGAHAIYVSGDFARAGGHARHGLAALDPASGRATAFNPAHTGAAGLLAAGPGRVYAIGRFGGAAGYRVTQLSTVTGRPTAWDPMPTAGLLKSYKNMLLPPFAVATAGDRLFLGGAFAGAGRPLAAVPTLARLRADGSLDRSWHPPRVSGPGCGTTAHCVTGLVVAGGTVYLGGPFDHVGGVARPGLAAFDATSGRVTGWNPKPHGAAVPRAVAGGKVFVTGTFHFIGGQPRAGLAALDPATGAADTTWAPSAGGSVDQVAVSGTTVYLGGLFDKVDGQPRAGLAALDLTTAAVGAWNPATPGHPQALAATDDGAVFSGAAALTRVDGATGAVAFVTPQFGSALQRLAVAGDTVYADGGDGLGAFDAATGARRPWNPEPNYVWSESQAQLIGERGLAVAGSDVYAAGAFWHTATAVTGPLARLDGSSGATLSTTLAPVR